MDLETIHISVEIILPDWPGSKQITKQRSRMDCYVPKWAGNSVLKWAASCCLKCSI